MKIVAVHLEPGAVGWFRCWNWTTAMKRRGHKVTQRVHESTQFDWATVDDHFRGADVVIAGRMHHPQVFSALLAGRKLYGYKLVVDTDDNSDEIPSYNQSFADYHGGAGTARIVRGELREADLVTVSTPRMVRFVEKYAKRVVVTWNNVDTSLYSTARYRQKEERHRNDFRIYWGGGGGHYNDLLIVKDALLRIFRERPNVKLVFSNFMPDWAADLPPFRCFMVRFAHFNAYPKVLRWICPDIAIAPLVDNEFNRCKSHVKYLDYGMASVPGIYQDLDPYDTVTHGATGLKATTPDDWYAKLNVLIDNAEMRTRIAANAREDILAKWTIDTHAPAYEKMLLELVGGKAAPELTYLSEGEPIEAVAP